MSYSSVYLYLSTITNLTMHSLAILLPYNKANSAIYTGCLYHDISQGLYVAYFINYQNNRNPIEKPDRKNIIGCCSKKSSKKLIGPGTGLHLDQNYITWMPGYNKIQLFIENKEVILSGSRIIMYNLKEVVESQTLCHLPHNEDLDYISTLYRLLHETDSTIKCSISSFNLPSTPKWMAYSMFLQHLFHYVNLLKWLVKGFKKKKKLQIAHVNYLLTIMLDLLLGYSCLYLLSQFNVHYTSFLMGMLEKLVNSLHSLLKWLMGSPAGLKLNNAFNKMLGNYFSYHIQLWWIFLDVSGEKLDIILNAYQYLGYMGLSFQAAMICDLICISIFHSYCIYVYAARLFNLQVSGLTALMRLFLGRKYNPLRGGVDSCEYTNQELFVGTVAFTILLLLLPTTAMYYTVFTLLRLLSLAVQHCLAKLVYLIQTLPIYQSILWLLRSSKVKGDIFMETANIEETSRQTFNIKLKTKPLKELTAMFLPPVTKPKSVDFSQLLYNLFTGKQIL